MQGVQKIGNAFNLHKSFSGRQLNAASRKSLKIQASPSRNEEPFRTEDV